MTDKPLLRIRGLTKRFSLGRGQQLTAVDQLNLDVQRGEVLGVVGESGSGKSTLAKLIAGLHDKTAGEIYFADQLLPRRYRKADFQRQAKQLQMIFQDPVASLNPRMTVAEIIAEPLRLQGQRQGLSECVAQWLQRVGLPVGAARRYPHEFSGGQRQRIGIARALIARPQLLICDEPISALDVSVQAQVVNLLVELKNELGLTIVFIAHDLAMVRHLSDRVAVMYLGRLLEVATTEALFHSAQHPYTQLLLASSPEPDPANKKIILIESNDKKSLKGVRQGCCFAPRCPKVEARCWEETPLLKGREHKGEKDIHQVACHLVD